MIATEQDRITLTGLTVFANHGYYAEERREGQRFVLDVTVWLDVTAAAQGDDLGRTLSYSDLALEVADAVRRDPVDLIETVAERVAALVLAHDVAERTQVTVHKPDAPIDVEFADVSVTITRARG